MRHDDEIVFILRGGVVGSLLAVTFFLAMLLWSQMSNAQQHLGVFKRGEVIPVIFPAYNTSTGASITITGLAVTDIEIYKRGSITQRSSDDGYALIDTDGIDIDSVTGLHGFTVDTADDDVAGFWEPGGSYTLVLNSITINSQTVVGVWTFQLDPNVITYGTAQEGSTSTTLVMAATTSFPDHVLQNRLACILAGTGVGQCQVISAWDGDEETATVPGWAVTPDDTSVYAVYASSQATLAELAASLDAAGIATVTDVETVGASTSAAVIEVVEPIGTRVELALPDSAPGADGGLPLHGDIDVTSMAGTELCMAGAQISNELTGNCD